MKKSLFAVLVFLTLLTGCFKSENTNTVSTDGSTSMEKVIGILGEVFTENKKGVNFTYNPTGSGTGISSVLENRCDIGLSSRNLKQAEIEKGLTETILAYDGIAIIVNKENPISNLQLETLEKIFTGVITNWKELGGSDSEIVLIGREEGSGTRDGFESITKTSGKCKYRQELTSIGNQVENIVELATNLDSTYSENYLSIGRMAESTIRMVKLSIQAFVNKDLEMAKEAKLYDDIIDEFFCLIKNDLVSIIHQNPDSGEYAIDVLMIAKYFERIGDHATNIAEWVEFSITGMHGE